ncbi:uncharacterized protein LOC130297702 isoform X2 [Hyla sarda]|nr:uncharacterized protein LOC130297702 isoform X2 [Hyla sarda]XP_056406443.1 uncharacterized protein LOC130297702 isoform X2 [Hyla sarda]XP_056406444.1 uncharacterized protein LOC130297702 isoform X2 [Hyla sarda]
MMTILVIGLVYDLLLHSRAAGEHMVKVQICKDVFEKAIADSLNEIEESELRDHFTEEKNGKGNGKTKSNDLSVTNVELEVLPGIQILNNSIEITFPIQINYGDKMFYQKGRKWIQNDYVFLDMDIVTILQLNVKRDKIVYSLQDCDVFVRSRDTNQDRSWFLEVVTAFRDKWRRKANQKSSLHSHRQDYPEG